MFIRQSKICPIRGWSMSGIDSWVILLNGAVTMVLYKVIVVYR